MESFSEYEMWVHNPSTNTYLIRLAFSMLLRDDSELVWGSHFLTKGNMLFYVIESETLTNPYIEQNSSFITQFTWLFIMNSPQIALN